MTSRNKSSILPIRRSGNGRGKAKMDGKIIIIPIAYIPTWRYNGIRNRRYAAIALSYLVQQSEVRV